MKGDRMVFHLRGGAAVGGHTLTAWSSDPDDAKAEADSFAGWPWPLDPGSRWVPRAAPTGPDDEGNLYFHFDHTLKDFS